jgi:predicted CopG family antitoxin
MSRLINISDSLYSRLKAMKGRESFTVVIEKLVEKKSNTESVLACAGKGKVDEKEMIKIKEGWKKWTEKYV